MKTSRIKVKRLFLKSSEAGSSANKEVNTMPSQTVPDQSLSVRQIIDKFQRGLLPDVSLDLEYSEDLPDLRGLDISQLHQMKLEAQEEIEDIQQALDYHQNKPQIPQVQPDQAFDPKVEDPI